MGIISQNYPLVSQLFEEGKYAKLSVDDEEKFSSAWNHWNLNSNPF